LTGAWGVGGAGHSYDGAGKGHRGRMPNSGAPQPPRPPTAAPARHAPSSTAGERGGEEWPAREAALLERIREKGVADREAWGELLVHHQDRLYAVCLRMVGREAAADLTQDAMVKILQGLEGYDGRSQLSTWMIRIAMNGCLSWLRGQKLRRHKGLDGQDEGSVRGLGSEGTGGRLDGELSAGLGVQTDERHVAVSAALAGLPDDQRAILILRDVHGLDYEQVGAVLEIAVGTVKSRLFRARLALRELVEERLGNSGRGGNEQS